MIERGLSSSAARKRFTARSPAPYFTNSSASSSALSTSPLISVFDCTSLIVSPSLARQDRTKTKDQRPKTEDRLATLEVKPNANSNLARAQCSSRYEERI